METATKKVPGGKLLRIKANVVEGKMSGVQISGDFFMSPPEAIKTLEEALEGFPASETQELVDVIEYVIEREKMSIQGFSSQDLAELAGELK